MITAILTTAFIFLIFFQIWKGYDGDAIFFTAILCGLAWALTCLVIIPFEAGPDYEKSRVELDNSTLVRYELNSEDDVIIYEDEDGIGHAILDDNFRNGESEAALVEECNAGDPFWSLWHWEDCQTILVGNIN